MSRFFALLISAIIIAQVLAASESTKPVPENAGTSAAPKKEQTKGQKTAPSSENTSSEKVSADKAVSFPTDI